MNATATITQPIHRPAVRRGDHLCPAVDVGPGATGVVMYKVGPELYGLDDEPLYVVRLDGTGQIVSVRASHLELIKAAE
jgi:hypothetical protein